MCPSVCLCPLTELQIYWSGSIIRQGRCPDQDLDFLEHCKTGVKACSHLAALVCNWIYMDALLTLSYGKKWIEQIDQK